jgi:hypothetical protein
VRVSLGRIRAFRAEANDEPAPGLVHQSVHGPSGSLAAAVESDEDLGERFLRQIVRAAGELGGIGFVGAASGGQRRERPRSLGVRLAVDEPAVVRPERLLQRALEGLEKRGIDGKARFLRFDEELDDPGGERDVASSARPVGGETVRVDRALNPLDRLPNPALELAVVARRFTQMEELPELDESDLRPGPADALLGAAVRVVEKEVESRRHGDESGLVGDEDPPPERPGPEGLVHFRQENGCGGGERLDGSAGHAFSVVYERDRDLKGIPGGVRGPLDSDFERELPEGKLTLLVERRRFHVHGKLDALRLVRHPVELESSRAFEGRPSHFDLGPPRPALAFDHATDAGGGEPVARTCESGKSGLNDHREAHGDARGGKAEPVGTARDFGAELEVREVIRERDVDQGRPRRIHENARVEVWNGLEVLSHRDTVEKRHRFFAFASSGVLRERQEAKGEIARIPDGEKRADLGDEVGKRVEPGLGAEREDGLVHEPERHFARNGLLRRIAKGDLDTNSFAGKGALGMS